MNFLFASLVFFEMKDRELIKALLFAIIPAVVMLIGALAALIRKPGKSVRSYILHFAAGVIFSVAAAELLPVIMKKHSPFMIGAGFFLGLAVVLRVRELTNTGLKQGRSMGKMVPWGLLTGIGADIFTDGFILGIGFTAGTREGTMLAIALSTEFISIGLTTSSELRNKKITGKKTMGIITALVLLFYISAVVSSFLFRSLGDKAIEIVLSFGLSALLYLVTEELLKEAHQSEESIWHTSAFFIGFFLFVIFGMLE